MYKQYILMRTSITCMNTTTAIEKQNKTEICNITKLNIIFDYPITCNLNQNIKFKYKNQHYTHSFYRNIIMCLKSH